MPPPKSTTALLKQLRVYMQDTNYVSKPIQAYIIPSVDAHHSEYLAECDQFRSFISGFSGSAGTAVVTNDHAYMWTDGRYYLQATQQMDNNWTLMKEGDPTTPKPSTWLVKNLPTESNVGVDPKLITTEMFLPLRKELETVGHKLIPIAQNLIEMLWTNRPKRPSNVIEPLSVNFTGKLVKDKLNIILDRMKEQKAEYLVLTALDEIAWFLNLRGSDIQFNPVFFSYVIISGTGLITLFVNSEQVTKEVTNHLKSQLDIEPILKPYDGIVDALKKLSAEVKGFVWFSEFSSYALTSLVPEKNLLLTNTSPVELMKAVKNDVEAKGMKNAHIKDAAALCSYFAWLEKNVANGGITEISGAEKLHSFRKLQEDFIGDSFDTISSVGPHGAIIHYKPDKSTDVPIRIDTLYLCDSGGQYRDGTTDVTRTLHFGTPTEYQKECYTRVLKGQLKLARRVFPSKIKGNYLDSFARQYLWDIGLDYGHGTGHGIGHYLNVHEGPMQITYKLNTRDPGLEANMFVSNEPGYYEDGEFGIRIEDIVQIVPANPRFNFNNRGFLTFDTMTLVPKSPKLIKVDMLTDAEIEQLNNYHQKCRDVIGPLLDKQGQSDGKEWLWKETQPISK